MKKNILKIAVIAAFTIASSACRKEENTTPTPTAKEGTVLLEFYNKVGGNALKMDGTSYKNQNGDDFTVSKFNYYISNIKLNNADGSSYAETESYHLLQQETPASLNFALSAVPAGTYKSITFTIGVDSLRNVSGVQSGALDPANGMFWMWSTGYIMVKMEGTSPQSTAASNELRIHVGGITSPNNTISTVTLALPNDITVNNDENHIHLTADLVKMFGSTNIIDFATTNVVHMPGAAAKKVADNYKDMFSVTLAGK
ncbi:MAG: hypothetical protein IT256_00420 [Chitinophagaceae bacterium]|nr:hypothetical protein [Chitinophagaceae bacterium]